MLKSPGRQAYAKTFKPQPLQKNHVPLDRIFYQSLINAGSVQFARVIDDFNNQQPVAAGGMFELRI